MKKVYIHPQAIVVQATIGSSLLTTSIPKSDANEPYPTTPPIPTDGSMAGARGFFYNEEEEW